MYGYIYKTTNLVNGKIYIGQKHSNKFLGNKYLGSGKRFKDAVKHYGEEAFKVELLEEVESKELMDEREIYWIAQFNSTDSAVGYNMSKGGNVNRAMIGEYNPSKRPEVREKISKKMLGNKYTLGRKHTQEELLKISLGNKGKIISQATREKLSNNAKTNPNYGMRGKHCSTETKEKLRLVHLGKQHKSKGYIHITNEIEDKMILPNEFETYEKQGWRRGRKKFSKTACSNISRCHKGKIPYNKGYIWVTNGIQCKCISKEDFETLDSTIWRRGRKLDRR